MWELKGLILNKEEIYFVSEIFFKEDFILDEVPITEEVSF